MNFHILSHMHMCALFPFLPILPPPDTHTPA